MKVTAQITCDNQAFFDTCAGNELARIFRELADQLAGREIDRLGAIRLLDANGNSVGMFWSEN